MKKIVKYKNHIIVGVIAFLAGAIFSTMTITVASLSTVKGSANADMSNWVSLKEVDDSLLESCSSNFGIVSSIFYAQQSNDKALVDKKTAELVSGAKEATALAEQRNAVLKRLGY